MFSNLPVSGIQGQTEMKRTKFKINKLTTAACTKQSRKRQDFKKGFLWGGSDGVDHVTREVLQHGVANRSSPIPGTISEVPSFVAHVVTTLISRARTVITEGFNDWEGQGYDDFVPGEVTKTTPSGDETT